MQDNQLQFGNMTDEEFRTMFLQAANGGAEEANDFFGIFQYAYEIRQGNYSNGLNQGISLLMNCRSIDEEAYGRMHKGTPFYWLGIAAFLVHDHETATFFYDAAVSEDLRIGAHPINNPTPALRFIQIEDDPEFLAHPLIMAVQARVEEVISDYNERPRCPVDMADISLLDIRERFLRLAVSPGNEGWRSLATAFISFFIEWDYRNELLDLRAGAGTVEPFFLHLFKGCVLFESLLKGNPRQRPDNVTLGRILHELRDPLGIPPVDIREDDFATILADLAEANNSIGTAIQFTGKIRNTVGS